MAATLGRLVQRSASDYGGRPIKWLGDGVMIYFDQPVEAVARLAMNFAWMGLGRLVRGDGP